MVVLSATLIMAGSLKPPGVLVVTLSASSSGISYKDFEERPREVSEVANSEASLQAPKEPAGPALGP